VAATLSPGDFALKDVLFVWPVPVPKTDGRGRGNAWNTTAREAAILATTRWVRLTSNVPLGAYDVSVATVKLPDPEWPTDKTFNEILRIAFPRHGKHLAGAQEAAPLPFAHVESRARASPIANDF
jgi:hypothetical protein